MRRRTVLLVALCAFGVATCAPSYKDLSTDNGRQAILDQADDFLTAGNCESAINLLDPLVHSPNCNNAVLMKYSSAFACKGGINFPNLIGNLRDLGGQDIWSVLVKTNFSSGIADGHMKALDQAAYELFQTAVPQGYTGASQRTADANTFMVFIQLNMIATVIAPLGQASSTTGQKTQSITGKGSTNEKCHVLIAFGQTTDSLQYVSAGSAIDNVVNNVNTTCQTALGGPCPKINDIGSCFASATYQAYGGLLIDAIDTIWQ